MKNLLMKAIKRLKVGKGTILSHVIQKPRAVEKLIVSDNLLPLRKRKSQTKSIPTSQDYESPDTPKAIKGLIKDPNSMNPYFKSSKQWFLR